MRAAGRVLPLEQVTSADMDDTFLYDLCKRADMTWDNVQLPGEDPCVRWQTFSPWPPVALLSDAT
jgi:hypothetical protein